VIQLDITLPLGRIAKKLAKVTDEVVFYGKATQPLYLVAMDPSKNLLVKIDAGITIDNDVEAGIQVKELAETSKGVRYKMDYEGEAWRITYETSTGLKVRKKISGLEPSIPVSEALSIAGTRVVKSVEVDRETLSRVLDELGEGDIITLKFTKGSPGKLVASLSDVAKGIEAEAQVGEVPEDFEVKVSLDLLSSAVEILEPFAKTLRLGVDERGILVVEPSTGSEGTRILIAPVEG
jgi:hypothetical protein